MIFWSSNFSCECVYKISAQLKFVWIDFAFYNFYSCSSKQAQRSMFWALLDFRVFDLWFVCFLEFVYISWTFSKHQLTSWLWCFWFRHLHFHWSKELKFRILCSFPMNLFWVLHCAVVIENIQSPIGREHLIWDIFLCFEKIGCKSKLCCTNIFIGFYSPPLLLRDFIFILHDSTCIYRW